MTIEVKNAQNQSIEVLVDNKISQEVDFKQDIVVVPVYEDVPLYEGGYEVTPKVTEQTLPTAEKMLMEDMVITSIPFFNVSNSSGGSTVFIGNEV